VLVVCDPRILSRSYGAVFLESLPPMPRTRDLAAVQRFFAQDGAAAIPVPEPLGGADAGH
jgi:ATP-dependent DNA helicase DinG